MREVIWSEHFSECVERLGGARAVDHALEPILEALSRNPYGFPAFENDHVRLFRYARTKPIGDFGDSYILAFTIDEDRNVVLQWIDDDLSF